MAARRLSLAGAGLDLAGLTAAFGLGGIGLPVWALALSVSAHLALWAALKRQALSRHSSPARAFFVAATVLVAVQSAAYGLGFLAFSTMRG